jgi:hypothetical protein
MSSISLRLPESLHKKAKDLAKKEKTSINQLVSMALAEKISALATEEYIQEKVGKADKKKFLRVLGKVKNSKPQDLDI